MTEREIERGIQIARQTAQTDRPTNRQIDGQTEKRETGRQRDRQTDRQKKARKQTDKKNIWLPLAHDNCREMQRLRAKSQAISVSPEWTMTLERHNLRSVREAKRGRERGEKEDCCEEVCYDGFLLG